MADLPLFEGHCCKYLINFILESLTKQVLLLKYMHMFTIKIFYTLTVLTVINTNACFSLLYIYSMS